MNEHDSGAAQIDSSSLPMSCKGNCLPGNVIVVSLLFILLGAFSICDMVWHTRFGEPKLDPAIVGLPVGIGLLRLRWVWRRIALAVVWLGWAMLLVMVSVQFARANGVKLLPGPRGTTFDFFGWEPNDMQLTWPCVIFCFGEAALLAWVRLLLRRPRVKSLYDAQRGKGAAWPENLAVMAVVGLAFGWMPGEVRIQEQALTGASAETWSPALAPGRKPDLQEIYNEARTLRNAAQYEESLQREIWYFNHALEYDRGLAGVRLSFTLLEWTELGRRYPKATQALIEIRDHDMQQFFEPTALPDWLQEISSAIPGFARVAKQSRFQLFQDILGINRCLSSLGYPNQYEALIKTLVIKDPKLARFMGYKVPNSR
jgi:hypothetical protein